MDLLTVSIDDLSNQELDFLIAKEVMGWEIFPASSGFNDSWYTPWKDGKREYQCDVAYWSPTSIDAQIRRVLQHLITTKDRQELNDIFMEIKVASNHRQIEPWSEMAAWLAITPEVICRGILNYINTNHTK